MQMNPLYSPVEKVLNEILAIPVTLCSGANDNCPDAKITKAFSQAQQMLTELNLAWMSNHLEFLHAVSLVETDGRSCPAADRQRQLRKLLDNSWRNDLSIVTNGLRYAVITLSKDDLVRLSPTEE